MGLFQDFFDTSFGTLLISSNGKGIVSINKLNEPAMTDSQPDKFTEKCKTELAEYFSRERTSFTVTIDISFASEFYQSVWRELQKIKYGHTCSYSDLAQAIHKPKAVRAVGLANGRNPIPIVIPCHRVIGANGDLVGYGMGLEVKKQLLMLESPAVFGIQETLF